jgi:bifunctional enzyme CysN/CysC
LQSANVGDSVMLTLQDEIDISRGDMIVRANNLPQKSNRVDAVICWMSEEPLKVRGDYWVQHTTRQVKGFVSELNYKIDVDTMHRDAAETLMLNEIGRIQLTTTQPLYYDRYQLNRATGSFVLIDPATNNTVAAGMIRSKSRSVDQLMADEVVAQPARPKSSNVVWEQEGISLAQREGRHGHKAAVLWFTGLSGSGKSTIAKKLEQVLFQMGVHTMYLDGDNLRHGRNGDLGFSSASRQENIRRAGEVAKLAFAHGMWCWLVLFHPLRPIVVWRGDWWQTAVSSKSTSNVTWKWSRGATPKGCTPKPWRVRLTTSPASPPLMRSQPTPKLWWKQTSTARMRLWLTSWRSCGHEAFCLRIKEKSPVLL